MSAVCYTLGEDNVLHESQTIPDCSLVTGGRDGEEQGGARMIQPSVFNRLMEWHSAAEGTVVIG